MPRAARRGEGDEGRDAQSCSDRVLDVGSAPAVPFAPSFGSVSGNSVLLETLSFHADAIGDTDLVAPFSLGDLTEGFALGPFGFADVAFETGSVNVIPEPAPIILLCCSLWFLGGPARRGWRRSRPA